jgi:hypothetical protein
MLARYESLFGQPELDYYWTTANFHALNHSIANYTSYYAFARYRGALDVIETAVLCQSTPAGKLYFTRLVINDVTATPLGSTFHLFLEDGTFPPNKMIKGMYLSATLTYIIV